MALILTGFRQNHKTQAIPTSVAKIINARQGSGPSWGFASREHRHFFPLPFIFPLRVLAPHRGAVDGSRHGSLAGLRCLRRSS